MTTIGDFRCSTKDEATAILVDLVKRDFFIDWLKREVGYVPYADKLPKKEELGLKESLIAQQISLGKSLGVHGKWEWFKAKNEEKNKLARVREIKNLKDKIKKGVSIDEQNKIGQEIKRLKAEVKKNKPEIERIEAEIKEEWRLTLPLKIPYTRFCLKDIIPPRRKETVILREIIERATPGYNGYVERKPPEHNDTTLMLWWMCRTNESTEFWKSKARGIFENITKNYDTGDLQTWFSIAKKSIGDISEKSLATFLLETKKEIESLSSENETVKTWDFFYGKQIEKIVSFPVITSKTDWEYIADYFLLSASVSFSNETDKQSDDSMFGNDAKTVRYKSKHFK